MSWVGSLTPVSLVRGPFALSSRILGFMFADFLLEDIVDEIASPAF